MELPEIASPQLRLDADGHLDQNVPCVRCSYNLRGLRPENTCPECGTAVGRSLQGNLLRFAPPEWVETLTSGMNWIVAGILVGIVASFVAAATGAPSWPRLITQALAIVGVIGYWKVATPAPASSQAEPAVNARKLVRFTAVLSYVLGLSQVGALQLIGGLAAILGVIGGICRIVGYFAFFLYARKLALRIPNHQLAEQTTIVMWGFIVVGVFGLVMTLAVVATPAGQGLVAVSFLAMGCFTSLGMLVFAIWALVLIIRFRRELSQAAQQALQTWASPLQPPPVPDNGY